MEDHQEPVPLSMLAQAPMNRELVFSGSISLPFKDLCTSGFARLCIFTFKTNQLLASCFEEMNGGFMCCCSQASACNKSVGVRIDPWKTNNQSTKWTMYSGDVARQLLGE